MIPITGIGVCGLETDEEANEYVDQIGEDNILSVFPFYGKNITKIIIPGTIKEIGFFGVCTLTTTLTSITIEEGVEILGPEAFAGHLFTGVALPNSVVQMKMGAFDSCVNLSSIFIPKNVEEIGFEVFVNCKNLRNIVVDSENTVFHSYQNCVIETTKKELVEGCNGSVFPTDGRVLHIKERAFQFCDGLTGAISIPQGVLTIGKQAFYGCKAINRIVIPSSVTSIGNYAFEYCSSLTSITINATTPPTWGEYNDVFDSTNNCPIYVPAASVDAYKTATYWSAYADRIVAIPNS